MLRGSTSDGFVLFTKHITEAHPRYTLSFSSVDLTAGFQGCRERWVQSVDEQDSFRDKENLQL